MKKNENVNKMAPKYCFVPSCTSNSNKDPEKHFIYIPKNASTRKVWCESVLRRPESLNVDSTAYCCIDHFNIDDDFEDIDNIDPAYKPKLKKGVVPCLKRLDNLSESVVSFTSFVSKSSDSAVSQPNSVGETQNASHGKDSSQSQGLEDSREFDVSSATVSSMYTTNVDSDSDWYPSEVSSFEEGNVDDEFADVSEELKDLSERKQNVLLRTELVKKFFGIELAKMFLIDAICNEAKISKSSVLMCLQKIKQNLSFAVLAFDYALSYSHCGRIFCRTISVLAKALEKFVVWSENDVVEHRLPIAFRANFNDVTSIIDCFEIQIQKPSNAVHQSHTWSQYKQCNTIKYLVSSTPDGIVNFISEGFGGRISDLEIVKHSGYLDVLPPNSVVMADRGFKSIESLLSEKNCRLVRPPSVSEGEEMTAEDVHFTKQVAALRIHIERVIKRFREFAILLPHATVNTFLISSIDEIVKVVSALVNIQSALIK